MSRRTETPCLSIWDEDRVGQGLKTDNLHLYHKLCVEGPYEIPIMMPTDYIPSTGLVAFDQSLRTVKHNHCVHGFVPQSFFSPVWTCPEKFIERLRKFEGVIAPSFPIVEAMSPAQRIWNTYRSRVLGDYFQVCGLETVPCATWGSSDTFAYCFDGIPEESVVAVSSHLVSPDLFRAGLSELVSRKHPTSVLAYGPVVDTDLDRIVFYEKEYLYDAQRLPRKMGSIPAA